MERMILGKHEFQTPAGGLVRRGICLGLAYCTVDDHCRATLGAHKQPAAQIQAICGLKLDIFALPGHDDVATYKEFDFAVQY